MRRAAVACAVVALSPGLAACGGDDAPSAKERYERGMRVAFVSLGSEMRRGMQDMRSVAKNGPRGVGLAYARFRRLAYAWLARLERLRPPPDVSEAHRLVVDGFRRQVDGWYRRAFRVWAVRGEKAGSAVFTHPRPSELRALLEVRRAAQIFRAHHYDFKPRGALP